MHDEPVGVPVKDALRLIDAEPVLDEELIALGKWISVYYCAPLGEVLRSMLPLASDIRPGKNYSLTEHNFSALGVFCSAMTLQRMPGALRDSFLEAAKKAAADTRIRGLEAQKEALEALKDKGVTIIPVDKEAFRKRVLPQTETFISAHPEAKPIVELIRSTNA